MAASVKRRRTVRTVRTALEQQWMALVVEHAAEAVMAVSGGLFVEGDTVWLPSVDGMA